MENKDEEIVKSKMCNECLWKLWGMYPPPPKLRRQIAGARTTASDEPCMNQCSISVPVEPRVQSSTRRAEE